MQRLQSTFKISMSKNRFIKLSTFLATVFSACFLSSCATKNYGDDIFRLQMASHGKDVMWVPTKTQAVEQMLALAQLTPDDILYDLGSGDGVIPIEAARRHRIKAFGIEYNPDLVALSIRNADRAGVSQLVKFKTGDIFLEDFSKASVVTLYLGEELNSKLKPKIQRLRSGTRIISNTFKMDSWIPDQQVRLDSGENVYLWIVPATIEGRWLLSLGQNSSFAALQIRQRNQFFDGWIQTSDKQRFALAEGKISGAYVSFVFKDSSNREQRFSGQIFGDELNGHLNSSLSAIGRRPLR